METAQLVIWCAVIIGVIGAVYYLIKSGTDTRSANQLRAEYAILSKVCIIMALAGVILAIAIHFSGTEISSGIWICPNPNTLAQ